jgi:hypothetical protein
MKSDNDRQYPKDETDRDPILCPFCGSDDWACWDERNFACYDKDGWFSYDIIVGYMNCGHCHKSYTHQTVFADNDCECDEIDDIGMY